MPWYRDVKKKLEVKVVGAKIRAFVSESLFLEIRNLDSTPHHFQKRTGKEWIFEESPMRGRVVEEIDIVIEAGSQPLPRRVKLISPFTNFTMMACNHRDSPERHHLPMHNGLIAPHPACRECGYIKNISPDKAKKLGYFANVLAEMKSHRGRKLLSDAQIRLILKELEKVEGFDDDYFMSFTTQKAAFIRAVRKYSSLSPSFVESFLSS